MNPMRLLQDHKSMTILYVVILIAVAIYSYALIDPNITLISHPLWVAFRDPMVRLGYHNRGVSILIYCFLIFLLYGFHYLFLNHIKRRRPLTIALVVAGTLLLSYPFLSHDFFNYMFDARILTHYGQNPYLHKALDFPSDQWLRFLQWTHRPYPYGPTFLPLTLIPSFLSLGKFSLGFVLFKSFFVTAYLTSVYCLNKLNKNAAVFFATHPLVIIEGVINSHNDLVAVALALMGIYFLQKNRGVWGRVLLLASGGIKYLTLPLLLLRQKTRKIVPENILALGGITAIIVYLSIFKEVQPWYFLNYFALLPFFPNLLRRSQIFFAGLLLSYYPYIYLGGWDKPEKVIMKHNIIIIFGALNLLYILYLKTRKETISDDRTPH